MTTDTEKDLLLELFYACRAWQMANGDDDRDAAFVAVWDATNAASAYIDGPSDAELDAANRSRGGESADMAYRAQLRDAGRLK